jgi:hypothetical protein
MARRLLVGFSIIVLALTGGCGAGVSFPVGTFSIQAASQALFVGQTEQLSVQLLSPNGTPIAQRAATLWSSASPAIATVSPQGLLTCIAPGTTSVSVSSQEELTGSASFSCSQLQLSVTGLPSLNLVGQSYQLQAMAAGSGVVTTNITALAQWHSADASVVTVTTAGLLTCVANGSIQVIADYLEGSAAVLVKCTSPTLLVSGAGTPIPLISSTQFTATLSYANGTMADVTSKAGWQSTSPAVATVSSSGLLTCLSPGTTSLTASSGMTTGSASATCSQINISITGVPSLNLLGQSAQLQAVMAGLGIASTSITASASWSSTNPTAAVVSNAGILTCSSNGSTQVTATYFQRSASVPITCTSPTLSIAGPATPTPLNGTAPLTATLSYANGTSTDVTSSANWQSSPAIIAVVSPGGVLTCLSPGTTSVTATSGTTTSSIPVTCSQINISLIGLPSLTVVGETYPLQAFMAGSGIPSANITAAASWSSSNLAAASLSNAGVLTCFASGTSQVTATYLQRSAAMTVVCTTPILSISVPATPTPVNGTAPLTATLSYANGTTTDVTSSANWKSAAPTVAIVSSGGLLTCLSPGTASVNATSGTTAGSASATCSQVNISVTGLPSLDLIGQTSQLQAIMLGAGIGPTNVTATASWSSTNPAVATITNAGLLTCSTSGTTQVSATYLQRSASVSVPCSSPTLTISGAAADTPVDSSAQLTAILSYVNGTVTDVTSSARWQSASPIIATVSPGGLLTCLAPGTTNVTASSGTTTGSAVATCSQVNISVTGVTTLNALGQNSQLQAVMTGSGVGPTNITATASWSSANPDVATVTGAGMLTCVATGSTQVSATYLQRSGSVPVSCTSPTLSISGVATPISISGNAQLAATLSYADGTSKDVTSLASWQSSTPTVATISPSALLTCLSEGSAIVAASIIVPGSTENLSSPASAACVQTVASFSLSPSIISTRVGAAPIAITATALDSSGNPMTIQGALSWTSSSPIATVSTTGVISCIGSGSTPIVVVYGTVSGSASLACAPPSMNTPSFYTEQSEEFVGPFNSWANVKTVFGAVGDGVADDTFAIQSALDSLNQQGSSPVLWFPIGTYKITQPLVIKGKGGFRILGEDPNRTRILWQGSVGGVPLTFDASAYFTLSRFTFDGGGVADVAVDIDNWNDLQQGYYSTFNEISDLHILHMQNGIKLAVDAETSLTRIFYDNLPGYALAVGNYNTLNIFVTDSLFLNSGTGVTNNLLQAGQFNVYNSFFAGSTVADMLIHNTGYFTARHNTSVGSHQFWDSLNCGSNNAVVTLQNNTVLDPQTSAIQIGNLGPMMLIDNVIRQKDKSIPTVLGTYDPTAPKALFTFGNTFSPNAGPLGEQGSAFFGTVISHDDSISDPSLIPDVAIPTDVYHPQNYHGQIFEVAGFTGTDIQNAIDAALASGQSNPVVHFPYGTYNVGQELRIPDGSRIQLVGDEIDATVINSSVTGGQPAVQIGTGNVSVRDMKFHMQNPGTSDGIALPLVDQGTTQVTLDQVMLQSGNAYSVNFDGVEHLTAEMFNTYTMASVTGVNASSGPFRQSKRATLGITNFYTGSLQSRGTGTSFNVSAGGKLMVQDNWHDGGDTGGPNFILSGAGTVTEQIGAVGTTTANTYIIHDFDGPISLIGLRSGGGFHLTSGRHHTDLLNLGLIGPSLSYLPTSTGNITVQNVENSYFNGSSGHIPETDTPTEEWLRKMLAQTRSEYPVQRLPMAPGGSRIRFSRVAVENAISAIHVTPVNPPSQGYFELTSGGQSLASTNSACLSMEAAGSGATETQWTLRDGDEGDFLIMPMGSDQALGVTPGTGTSLAVAVSANTGSYSQRWMIAGRGDGTFAVTNRATGAILSAGASSGGCIGVEPGGTSPLTAWTITAH